MFDDTLLGIAVVRQDLLDAEEEIRHGLRHSAAVFKQVLVQEQGSQWLLHLW